MSKRFPTPLFYSLVDFLHRRRALFLMIILGAVALVGSSTIWRTFRKQARTDLTVFLRAAEAVENKEDIYQVRNSRGWNYVYFPLLAVAMVPLTKLPLSVAAGIWYLISVASFFGALHLTKGLFPKPREGFLAVTTASVLCLPYFLDAFTRAQLGLLILFFCTAVFCLYKEKKYFWAGFLLSLGFTLKFSPIAAIYLYFLIRREWKVLFGSIIGGLVFLIFIPSLSLGFGENIQFLREYRHLVWHGAGDFKQEGVLWSQLVTPFSHKNQSIYAVVTRLIFPSADAIDNRSNLEIRLFALTCGLAFLSYIGRAAFTKKEPLDRSDYLTYSLFPMGMLFISPVAEMHHYSVLFMVYCASFMYLDTMRDKSRYALLLEIAVWLSAFGFISGYIWKEFRAIGFPLFTTLALCLCLFPLIYRKKPELCVNTKTE